MDFVRINADTCKFVIKKANFDETYAIILQEAFDSKRLFLIRKFSFLYNNSYLQTTLYSPHNLNQSKNLQVILNDYSPEPELSSCTSNNSFLVEIDSNNDISKLWRKQINSRFNRSKVNKNYKFPRVTNPQTGFNITREAFKSPSIRHNHYFGENKNNRSLSPYEINIVKRTMSKSPIRNDLNQTSKSPIPIRMSNKAKSQSKRLPKILKSSFDIPKIIKVQNSTMKKKQSAQGYIAIIY